MITGTLTDYDLMTEGVHAGRYGARIDDKPYPVMQHVDAFLLRLQKGGQVDVLLNKDGWISKISKAKGNGTGQSDIDRSRDEYNARARGTPTDTPGVTDVAGDVVEQTKEKMIKAGFTVPAAATPDPSEAMKDQAVERIREQVVQQKIMQSVTVPLVAPKYSSDELALVKATVAKGCTDRSEEPHV